MLALCGASLGAAPGALAQTVSPCEPIFIPSPDSGVSSSSSCSRTEVLNDTVETQRIDTFVTQILGRVLGGPTLFDETFSFAFASSPVAAGVSSAQLALTSFFGSDPFTLTGPTLLSSMQSLVSSVNGVPVVTSTTSTLGGGFVSTAFGPASILIGDLGLCTSFSTVSGPMGCAGGTPLQVIAGTLNINTNANYQFDIFRTITTTDTFNTLASYEIVGMLDSGGGNTIPEPSTFALLTFGLALVGWRARRRLQ